MVKEIRNDLIYSIAMMIMCVIEIIIANTYLERLAWILSCGLVLMNLFNVILYTRKVQEWKDKAFNYYGYYKIRKLRKKK